ncbi:MAG TPA: DNA sulfur modification protein DndB, partial [Conexibacter sp.]|nr:DNA sulfur modification protein DndB [Conexibacter sp.]
VVLELDAHWAIAVMSVGQLLQVVPDPIASEDARRVADDPLLQAYADLRSEVQRLVQGAKARNAHRFAEYLLEGADGVRPWVTPPITLFHVAQLQRVQLAPGIVALLLPHGDFLTAIDGETQRIAWGRAALEQPALMQQRIAVVIHHGKEIRAARQAFYDLNTREVKPNQAIAISMDSMDPATQITRSVIEASDVVRDRVNLTRRQLRAKDEDVLTISALRTGVVTTLLGEAGLQIGARPVELPADVEFERIEAAVVDVWTAILELLEEDLEPARRPSVVVSAPSILAGIGVLAHQALPQPPRRAEVHTLSVDEVVERLATVMWEREYVGAGGAPASPWDGIAGKFTPAGRFSIGGPKEVGHAVAKSLKDIASPEGRQVRGR